MRAFLRFVLFLLVPVSAFSQNYIWAEGEGGIGNDAANSVAVDDQGNSYITGNIAGKAEFNGTEYQGKGVYDVFIAKYDVSGNLLWVKTAGGNKNDMGSVIRYKGGQLYIAGYFTDTAYFESTVLIGKGETDGFIARYDVNGNLNWVRQLGGADADFCSAMDVDDAGNIFVSGKYETSIRLDTIQLSTSNIYNESFYARYTNAGGVVWAKTCAGTNSDLITGLAFDHNQSVYLCGFFSQTVNIGGTTLNSSSPSIDVFIGKIDLSGNLQWLKRAGGAYEDAAHGITCDPDGNPCIVGYFYGTALFDANSVTHQDYNDVFIARYDAAGNNLWVRAGKGQQLDVGYGITSDAAGNIFATGMFQVQINFDGQILSGPDREMFLVSYDKYGNMRWATKAGNSGTDCGFGVAVHNTTDHISISGYYLLNCTFGSIAVSYADANDLFVAVYDPPFVSGIASLDEQDLQLYPNPVTGDGFTIQLEHSEAATVKIYNAQGQLMKQQFFSSSVMSVNFQSAAGVYLAEIISETKTIRKKVVKR